MDQLFKDQFQGAEAPMDADAMWNNVEQQLPQQEQDNYLMFSLIGLVLSLMLLAAWFWPNKESRSLAANSDDHGSVMVTTKENHNFKPAAVVADKLPQKNYKSSIAKTTSQVSSWNLSIEDSEFVPFGKKGSETFVEDRKNSELKNESLYLPGETNVSGQVIDPLSSRMQMLAEREEENLLFAPDPKWSRCSDRRSWGLGFFIEAYGFGGYPLITNSIKADQSIDYSNYLSLWNQGEAAVSTMAGGFMLGLETRGGFSVSAGLEYQQIQNRLNRNQTIIERVTVFDEMAYYFLDSNNNRVYVADSVTTTRTYTRSLQAAKTHTLINLPLLLGYHNQIGNFRYGIIAGINLHLQNEFTGKVLDPSGQIIDANSGSPTEVYRTTMNMSFIGGLDFGYMTNDWLEVYLSPRFRYQPGSWLNANHPLESSMQLIGLQAGLRFHL